MTNGEKYKTVEGRTNAFRKFCSEMIRKRSCKKCILNDVFGHKCEFAWLNLEYKEELKPCPFCGGTAILYDAGIPYVRCDTCGTQTTAYQTPDEAIAAWNRRSS